jgi:hypothetical protein
MQLHLHLRNFLGLSSYIQQELGLQLAPTSHWLYSSKTAWYWAFLPYTFAIMGTLSLGLLFINKTILADGHL